LKAGKRRKRKPTVSFISKEKILYSTGKSGCKKGEEKARENGKPERKSTAGESSQLKAFCECSLLNIFETTC
jgi:hypothetical protein